MRSRHLLVLIAFLAILLFPACRKDGSIASSLFYGAWKTSYGDTILFAKNNGKNVLFFNNSMNPSMPNTTQNEYSYVDGKLAIKWTYDPSKQFRPYQSFSWVQTGKEFTIQGVEWFSFLSSTLTVFTFTKIQ